MEMFFISDIPIGVFLKNVNQFHLYILYNIYNDCYTI